MKILVSVFGEDEEGRQLSPVGPGTLRLVRIAKRFHLPHVSLPYLHPGDILMRAVYFHSLNTRSADMYVAIPDSVSVRKLTVP